MTTRSIRRLAALGLAAGTLTVGLTGTAGAHPYWADDDTCAAEWIDDYEHDLKWKYGESPQEVMAGPDGEGDHRPHGETPPIGG